MALNLSTILTSGDSSLIHAKQIWGCSFLWGKSFVIDSFSTCIWIKRYLWNNGVGFTLIKYLIYNWNICRDLKVISFILGLRTGYTKHQCFLCRWDSQDNKQHYIWKDWHSPEKFFFARFITFLYLAPPKCLRQYRFKLGLLKKSLKQWIEIAMDLQKPTSAIFPQI